MSVEEIKIQPDQDVIACLEGLLEQARSGELQSIAFIASFGNYITGNGWAGMDKNNAAIIGELVCLQHDLVNGQLVQLRHQPICE